MIIKYIQNFIDNSGQHLDAKKTVKTLAAWEALEGKTHLSITSPAATFPRIWAGTISGSYNVKTATSATGGIDVNRYAYGKKDF